MLNVKPSNRPTIVDILNKSFVRKKVAAYVNESLTQQQELAPTDVDDMYADGLREQAEKLMIPGYFDDSSSSVARLHRGGRDNSNSRPAVTKKAQVKPIKTQLEQKKEILKLKKEVQEKKAIESQLDALA